jgi:hypothetical protein
MAGSSHTRHDDSRRWVSGGAAHSLPAERPGASAGPGFRGVMNVTVRRLNHLAVSGQLAGMWQTSVQRHRGGNRTWGKEIDLRSRAQQQELRKHRGRGSWGKESASLYREARRRERRERRGWRLLRMLLG